MTVQAGIFFSRRQLWRITISVFASLFRVEVKDSFATLVCLSASEEMNLKMFNLHIYWSAVERSLVKTKLFKLNCLRMVKFKQHGNMLLLCKLNGALDVSLLQHYEEAKFDHDQTQLKKNLFSPSCHMCYQFQGILFQLFSDIIGSVPNCMNGVCKLSRMKNRKPFLSAGRGCWGTLKAENQRGRWLEAWIYVFKKKKEGKGAILLCHSWSISQFSRSISGWEGRIFTV